MKRERQPDPFSGRVANVANVAEKMRSPEDAVSCAGMDELLAVLGYKVRTSEMEEVAQKLEQLEQVICHAQEDEVSHLLSETVHYNPSHLSSWLETLLTELNTNPILDPLVSSQDSFLAPAESSTITSADFTDQRKPNQVRARCFDESCSSDYDLGVIPGKAIFTSPRSPRGDTKRIKSEPPLLHSRPVIVVDSQENGVRLVQLLMACAEAVQGNNFPLAEALVKQIGYSAVSQVGAMRKVATYFAQALACRIYSLPPENYINQSLCNVLETHFYEACPYLKFAHFTANQAILEAFQGKKRVHIVDFSMNQGMQWPALMQALALRPGGPPALRLTGIGPPSHDNSDHLQEVGWKLAQLAETIRVEFEYRGFVAKTLADLDASVLELRPAEFECVAVNSIFELHKLLARPGSVEKVLSVVKQMSPNIITVIEQEANHNGPVFLDRFIESLYYYSTLFDSLEGLVASQDKLMAEMYLGKQICNVVACEGEHRFERHEPLDKWRTRLSSSGLVPVHLGSNAFKQASMLLALFSGAEGYRVEEENGCLMLGWHTQPLITTSAWRVGNSLGLVP